MEGVAWERPTASGHHKAICLPGLTLRPHMSPELPPGRAGLVLLSVAAPLLTAPQVGGHMLQHLDLLDGLSPGEMHHEHPVAR